MDNAVINNLILKSEKPARYSGGEYNTPDMYKPCFVRFCICFPDVYEVAMSNLGIRILYHQLNDEAGVVCERCFAPWPDFGERLRNNDIPLFSLETRTPLARFDMIGFSFQYELSYTNMLYMLDLAGIPLLACSRGEGDPIVMGGGPCMFNPEPVADFLDIVQIGDGEEMLLALNKLKAACKKSGASRGDYLLAAAEIPGIYVPSLNQNRVKRGVVKDLEHAYFPTKVLVPNTEIVHDRGVVELFRGCTRGCRFCQAGMIYRPVRERSSELVLRYCREIIQNTGFEELSLNSLSTGDYSYLSELLKELYPFSRDKRVQLALPSLRLDSFSENYTTGSAKKGSLTFAPEAGTQRLRNVINKNITEQDYENTLTAAFKQGYHSVKLYFMMGLPTETAEDLKGLSDMAGAVRGIYRSNAAGNRLRVTVSCATFVPKAFTPFQWEMQDTVEQVSEKQKYLLELFKKTGISFHYHDVKTSVLEAALSRGDRKLSGVILAAYRGGALFDGWGEHFKYGVWQKAFEDCALDIRAYTGARGITQVLPWDFIDAGVTKNYLLRERERALQGVTTGDCRKGCTGCGMRDLGDGIC